MYISQLNRFARASFNVSDFNCHNKALTAKLLRYDYRYHKLPQTFSKFYRRHSRLVQKYNANLRKLPQQGISEPEFYIIIRKTVGKSNFAEQFRKLINRSKRIGYNPYIMRQTACLVVNSVTVDSYALLFNCTTVVRASDSMTFPSLRKAFTSGLGLDALSLVWLSVVQLVVFFNSRSLVLCWAKSTCLCFIIVINFTLFLRYGAWIELGSHYANRTFMYFLY